MEEIAQEVLAVFADEVREQTAEAAKWITSLERGQSVEERRVIAGELLRFAHTLKGNAGNLGMEDVASFAQAMEVSLQPLKSGEHKPSRDFASLLLEALVETQERVGAAASGISAPDPRLARRAEELLRPTARPEPAPRAEAHRGGPAPRPLRLSGELIRVAAAELGAVDQALAAMREVRLGLQRRADEVRRVLWVLEGALEGVDPELVRAVRSPLSSLYQALSADVGRLTDRQGACEEHLRRARQIPLDAVFASLAQAAADLGERTGKKVKLESSGGAGTIDSRLLHVLEEVLLELLANAVEHGVEPSAQREAAKKAPSGLIRVNVERRDAYLLLLLSDDGRGVDLDRVRRAAMEQNLAPPAAPPEALYELLFRPGLTSTGAAGRGMGLDVVKRTLDQHQGRVSLSSVPGRGTFVTVELPLEAPRPAST